MSDRTPSLAEVLQHAIMSQLISFRVGLPGRIEKFDPVTQLADVQPLLREEFQLSTGDTRVESLPIISNVPVFSPGGGEFSLTMPVEQGDSCWVMFSDRSLDVWNENGGIVDPVDPRRHDLSDAVCIVGVRPKASKLPEYDADAIQLGKMGGPRVRVKTDSVHLGVNHGEDSTELAAVASKVKQEIQALRDTVNSLVTTFNGHVHLVNTTGSPFVHTGTATPPSSPAVPPNPVQDVKCDKVFIK